MARAAPALRDPSARAEHRDLRRQRFSKEAAVRKVFDELDVNGLLGWWAGQGNDAAAAIGALRRLTSVVEMELEQSKPTPEPEPEPSA